MSTKIGIVVPPPMRDRLFTPAMLDELRAFGALSLTESTEKLSEAGAAEVLSECSIGIGSWNTVYPSADLLALCPDLKLWVHGAGSVKHMFGPHLDGRDLTIASCAPAIAESVAELVLGELIVGLKQILPNAAANRGGRAPKPTDSRTLPSSTIGVIGASQVGRFVIRNLRPFGPKILLYDPFVSSEEAALLGVELIATPLELCRRSDAVTLHTPNLPATRGLLGAAEFAAMRDDAVFVNASRGECIDEAALIAELEKGRLFAFLDVSAPEPAADDSPLRRLPNVVYTSHIAGGPDYRIGRQVVDDVRAFLNGQAPRMVVTADMLDRIA